MKCRILSFVPIIKLLWKGERVTEEFSPPLPPPPPPFPPSPLPIATVGWQYVTQCSLQFSG